MICAHVDFQSHKHEQKRTPKTHTLIYYFPAKAFKSNHVEIDLHF